MKKTLLFLGIYFLFLFNTLGQITFVGNMFPPSGTVTQGATGHTIYIQVYKAGVTPGTGQGSGINCEVYYGKIVAGNWTDITTQMMTYNVDIDNNDEYQATLNLPQGNYEYTCRCIDNAGTVWRSNGTDGALTVNAPIVVAVDYINNSVSQVGKNTHISWEVANVKDHDYYEIQYSNNGILFNTIGTLGENIIDDNNQKKFDFVHKNPSVGNAYYRIRQTDLDGMKKSSEVMYLEVEGDGISLIPLVTPTHLTFSYIPDKVQILNSSGQVLGKYSLTTEIDISSLPSGIYLMKLLKDGQNFSQLFAKF